jgi:D-3-phosphoglycerate dehydrogenase
MSTSVSTGPLLVLCLGHRFPDVEIERTVLRDVAEVVDGRGCDRSTLDDLLNRATGVLLGTGAQLDREALARMPQCKVVVRYGIGVDNIALDEAQRRGIVVANVPDYCVEEVATHTLALLLCAHRRVLEGLASVRGGRWDATIACGIQRLSTCALGLVGVGRIGQAVGRRAHCLGMRVLAFDPYASPEEFARGSARPSGFRELLEEADFVSIHCPLTPQTEGLFDYTAFRRMKTTAWLINTCRGGIVREDALVTALQQGWIAGAALDVLPSEPPPESSPLSRLENVIITPHTAWYSEQSVRELRRRAASQVRAILEGGTPAHVVVGAGRT